MKDPEPVPRRGPFPFWNNIIILPVSFHEGFRHRRYGAGMLQMLKAFLRDESGATAIEYGLIAAGISIAIISAVKGVGTKLNTTFSSISTQLK